MPASSIIRTMSLSQIVSGAFFLLSNESNRKGKGSSNAYDCVCRAWNGGALMKVVVKALMPISAVFVLVSGAAAHASDRGDPWLKYLKKQIPLEEKLVKVGAMRPEDLQYDIQIVSIGDSITKAEDEGNAAEVESLNVKLQSIRAQRLAFDRKIGIQHMVEAQGAAERIADAQRSMALDSRLPNGQPAGAPTSRSGGGAHVCGSGPGPGEVQVGEVPGSNGVAAEPLCAWSN
jgi:hypothetical protein